MASVQEYIDRGLGRRGGRARRLPQPAADVHPARAIIEDKYDAVFGGGRRDEEKARAKERVFSLRDEFGQWDPRNQRPELWNLYNGRHRPGEHIRVFPLSELDRAGHLAVHRRGGASPSRRSTSPTGAGVPPRRHAARRRADVTARGRTRRPFEATVRYRTVGDMTCTGARGVTAATPPRSSSRRPRPRMTERGATRADDRFSEAAMEDRKREGYF